ncbi:MAG: tyrosine-type recombinase/integrase [Filomicrobium sp.]
MAKTVRTKITAAAVNALQPGYVILDPELTGFGVRRQTDASVYFVRKRIKNRTPWITIGTHGAIGPDGKPWTHKTARDAAIRILGEIAAGRDPSRHRDQAASSPTLKAATEVFMAEHGPKLKARTREEYQRLLDKDILPALGDNKVPDVTRSQVARFHADLADTPRKANFALAVLSKFMSWAEAEEFRPKGSNPCLGIKKFKERKKERFLSHAEFVALGEVLTKAETENLITPYAAAAIRLLIFTGARRNEILTLEWRFADFERRVLRLPDSKTGEKIIRLNAAAVEVLTTLPRQEGNPYVIAGHKERQHLVNLQKSWDRVRTLAGLNDVRLHDLRHSFASMIASAPGSSLIQLGGLLGHRNPSTTARYAHLFDDPLDQLNESAGDMIGKVLNSTIPK